MSYDQCGARWGECGWQRELDGSTAHYCAEMVARKGDVGKHPGAPCRCACGKKAPAALDAKRARPDHLL